MALDTSKVKLDSGDAVAEAQACRTHCALFDFSFLECARIEGECAASFVEAFSGRSVKEMRDGEIAYAIRVDDRGRAQADLTLWKTGAQSFEIMSGRREDVADLLALNGAGARVTDLGTSRATFAVQGPRTLDVLRKLGNVEPIARLNYFTFCHTDLCGIPCTIGRLGYTGEAGVEIIAASDRAGELWRVLSAHARPAGFTAMDMLRIEAGFVLFSNEFRLPVSPREAGLGKFHPSAGQGGEKLRLVSFRAEAEGLSWPWRPANAPPRPTSSGVLAITSACDSAAAGGILGLGFVVDSAGSDAPLRDPAAVFRDIRLVPLPFYDTAKRVPRASWR
ncbi:MAG TPA: hypothetical protein VFT69_19865 [Pseudolabrys sp.]|nr:hypothetical protein [Pseudolabrys sp.]